MNLKKRIAAVLAASSLTLGAAVLVAPAASASVQLPCGSQGTATFGIVLASGNYYKDREDNSNSTHYLSADVYWAPPVVGVTPTWYYGTMSKGWTAYSPGVSTRNFPTLMTAYVGGAGPGCYSSLTAVWY